MNTPVTFQTLSPAVRQVSAQAVLESADVLLRLWPEGDIESAAFGRMTQIEVAPENLASRPVVDLVEPQDRGLLQALVDGMREGRSAPALRVRHSALLGQGTTACYTAHLAGDRKNIFLVGRLEQPGLHMAEKLVGAELTRARNHSRVASEARYQHLFEASPDGVLIVDAATGKIEDANRNAARLLETSTAVLTSAALTDFLSAGTEEIHRSPSANIDDLTMRLDLPGGWRCRLTSRLIRTLERTKLLVRLTPLGVEDDDESGHLATEMLRRTAVPVLLTDRVGYTVWANGAFASLLPGEAALGRPVADLISLPPYALEIALDQAVRHGRLLTSLSALEGRLAVVEDAHLTIVPVPSENPDGFGILIHMIAGDESDTTPAQVSEEECLALAKLVGRAPMRDLVRRSAKEIERHCIEAALRLTGNNRTEAAAVLSLSRQSFYTKLREHRLG